MSQCNCENPSAFDVPVTGLSFKLDGTNMNIPSDEKILGLVREDASEGETKDIILDLVDGRIAETPIGQGMNYSYEEQWTGRYWVNGKKIYQKTINTGDFSRTKIVAHNIANMDKVTKISGWTTHVVGVNSNLYPIPSPNPSMSVWCDSSNVTLHSGATTQPGTRPESYITLQYTCTDR